MNISLSLGLFSSHDIDVGSRYLLKSIAQQLDLNAVKKALDIGCGTGVLAISLKKKCPQAEISARDRDALACSLTRHNAQLNGVSSIQVEEGLFLQDLQSASYDLIVSNIPAKAGEPVITDFVHRSTSFLSPSGRVAVVVVEPLRSLMERCLSEKEILFQEHGKMYSIFHYRSTDDSEPKKDPGIDLYIRNRQSYDLEKANYQLSTVYNLPDFDQISWKDELLAQNMKSINRSGVWAFWNPGQGHFLSWLLSKKKPHPKKIYLLSRDILQLKVSQFNALTNGFKGEIRLLPVSMVEEIPSVLEDELDFLHMDIQPVSRSAWEEPLKKASLDSVKSGGYISWLGKSRDLQSLMKNRKGCSLLEDKKSRSWRSVILKKN